MTDTPGVFISYRRIDANWAAVALRHAIGRDLPSAEIFMDIESIEPGLDFTRVIHEMVDRCSVLLALIGPNWLTVSDNAGRRRLDMPHDWVRTEIVRALDRDIRVVPVLLDGAEMPPPDVLPDPLKRLASRNAMRIGHESHARDFSAISGFLGNHLPATKAPRPQPATPAPVKPEGIGEAIAQALLDAGTDPKTMIEVARMRSEAAQHDIEEAICRMAQPMLEQAEGRESDWALANKYHLARAVLSQRRAVEAEGMLRDLLPLVENALGPEHPNTLATRRSLALAALEQGALEEAKAALAPLPPDGGDPNPLRKGQTALLQAWIADLEGDRAAADRLLDEAEGHLAHLTPEHYARRELATYHSTRGPDGTGGTLLWMLDR